MYCLRLFIVVLQELQRFLVILRNNTRRMRVELPANRFKFDMASCETTRSNAYSNDLRWKIVWQRLALTIPAKRVARNLCVDQSTVYRICNNFATTGTVDKKDYPAAAAFRKLTEPAKYFILHLVLQQPGIYLREIQNELNLQLGVDISASALCVFLHKAGFTRQRLQLYAIQRDEVLRVQFAEDVSLYSREMLIFIDETGTDRRDALRSKGYSLRGKPACKQRLLVRGEHVSAICAMSSEGILACKLVHVSVNGDIFVDFIETALMPNLMPFDGYNPNSVVLMDNCSIHHIGEVSDLIQQTGALVHWLPPYSPDMNPIEEAFSKAKCVMRAMELEMQTLQDIDTLVYSAFSCITPGDCQGWITDSRIYNA